MKNFSSLYQLFCYQSSLSISMDFIEHKINKLVKFIHISLTICVLIVLIISFHIFQLNVTRQFAEYQDQLQFRSHSRLVKDNKGKFIG